MKKRLLAVLLCVMLAALLPTTAFAAGETTLDISTGDITIDPADGDYIITGSSTSYTVTVTGGTHNITLRDAAIDASSLFFPAFSINSGATVNLTLEGTNTLKGCDGFMGGCAGLYVPAGATVNITGQSDGTGSLTANSGTGAAGIGGNGGESCGTVTISGGTVTANGGDGDMFWSCGAGVGGGGSGAGGTVIISGGTVHAVGGSEPGGNGGAGIGGGGLTGGDSFEDQTVVTISGGTVYAEGGNGGAGIGSGSHGASGSSAILTGGKVTISGGNVIATGGDGGAGIGGGDDNNGGKVTITGGNIKATGGTGALNIGKGRTGAEDGTLTNGLVRVTLTTLTLDGAAADTPIAGPGTGTYPYGVDDVTTLDTNKLYFYLPGGTVVNGVTTDTDPARLYLNPNATPIIASYSGTLKLAKAEIADVTVTGTKDAALTAQDATITLTTERFKALAAGTDVSDWFTNLPAGLVATIKTSVAANAQTATVTFTGTPTVEGTTVMAIKLPKEDLGSGLTDLTVTTNPSAEWAVDPPVTTPAAKPATKPAAAVVSTSTVESPKTGDNFQPLLWLLLALMAGAGLVVFSVIRRKRQNGS